MQWVFKLYYQHAPWYQWLVGITSQHKMSCKELPTNWNVHKIFGGVGRNWHCYRQKESCWSWDIHSASWLHQPRRCLQEIRLWQFQQHRHEWSEECRDLGGGIDKMILYICSLLLADYLDLFWLNVFMLRFVETTNYSCCFTCKQTWLHLVWCICVIVLLLQ